MVDGFFLIRLCIKFLIYTQTFVWTKTEWKQLPKISIYRSIVYMQWVDKCIAINMVNVTEVSELLCGVWFVLSIYMSSNVRIIYPGDKFHLQAISAKSLAGKTSKLPIYLNERLISLSSDGATHSKNAQALVIHRYTGGRVIKKIPFKRNHWEKS